jgi:hypothetical protein
MSEIMKNRKNTILFGAKQIIKKISQLRNLHGLKNLYVKLAHLLSCSASNNPLRDM